MDMNRQETVSADFLASRMPLRPSLAVILGSGLGAFTGQLTEVVAIPYADIPHFPTSTVEGHSGYLLCGRLGGVPLWVLQGRFHYYEGYTMRQVTYPIRVLHLLGARSLLISNAAGGINPAFHTGDLMIIRDHINMMPNPLIGTNDDRFGPRFPDMTHTYDPTYIRWMEEEAQQLNIVLRKGVYVGLTGPSFETPAEYAFYARGGADAVGMSTVPEVIVARHAGMRVFGMSVITNEGYRCAEGLVNDGADVIRAAEQAAATLTSLFTALITHIGRGSSSACP
ncbi:MAG: purine nucleoside phosphorylase I, inosine and guanosine-specific [Tannerellaceae bacterium]|jgi:purine-nucleoside phosphorylase|nr:purine nucleoside phosphorylase I, inosine and guanosine-specific [Tannerellaceae bacterium]